MPNMTKGYCVSSAPGPVHVGEVPIQEVYGWLSSGGLTRRQLRAVVFHCLEKICPGQVVPVLNKKKPERCHFREHPSHPHRPDCRYKLLYDDDQKPPRRVERSDYDPRGLYENIVVDVGGLFAKPLVNGPATRSEGNKGAGADKSPVSTRQRRVMKVKPDRTMSEMDHLVEYLDTLQVQGQSWDKRFLGGLPGAKGPVPLKAAVVTAATSLEALETAKGQERFVFGRVVEAKVRHNPRYKDEAHFILDRADETQPELHLLLPLDYYDTIRPGHVVLIRGKLLNWRTPSHEFWFTTDRADMIAPRRYRATDGHRLLSQEEVLIDNYLHSLKEKYGIAHDVPGRLSIRWSFRECRQQFKGYRPDWILTVPAEPSFRPVILEYFGFTQKPGWPPAERYAEGRAEKRSFYTTLAGFRYVELDRPHDGNFEAMVERELAPYIAEALTPEPKPEPSAEIVAPSAPPAPAHTVVTEAAPAPPTGETVAPPPPSPVPEAPPTLARKAAALIRRLFSWKS